MIASTRAVTVVALLVGITHAQEAAPDGIAASDCSGIRATYEANRHAAFAAEGGYQARNPGQQWTTRFDGRGFETKPDAGGWTWGLELERYGFAGAQHEVTKPKGVTADGQRVAYAWDDTIEEWYVNDERGLEHGFTLRERPAVGDGVDAGAGSLALTFAVRGGLLPVVAGDGRGVSFTNGDGAGVLNYAGLSVFDADHRALAARFERVESKLVLSIDEQGAGYPLTVDPLARAISLPLNLRESSCTQGALLAQCRPWDRYLNEHSGLGAPGRQFEVIRLDFISVKADDVGDGRQARRTSLICNTGCRFIVASNTTFDRQYPLVPRGAGSIWRVAANIPPFTQEPDFAADVGYSDPEMFERVWRGVACGPPPVIFEVER